jgi:metal-responsive CopG/Arc/MetJ family transcriptional regulator
VPTSVHIPDRLLQAADKRAKALGISRNRLIVQALQHELEQRSDWPKGFFDLLRATDKETAEWVDEMMAAIRESRRSKPPIQF